MLLRWAMKRVSPVARLGPERLDQLQLGSAADESRATRRTPACSRQVRTSPSTVKASTSRDTPRSRTRPMDSTSK